jgi:hypothetical protein
MLMKEGGGFSKGKKVLTAKNNSVPKLAAWNGSYVMNYEPAVMKIIAACNG